MKNKKFVAGWVSRAESNLTIAKSGRASKKVLYDDLCFECQQAVEKSLKAILISIDKEFEKTHSIERLLESIKEAKIDLPSIINQATFLTSYATTTRYPGDYIPATKEDYKKALKIAEKVFRWTKIILEKKNEELF